MNYHYFVPIVVSTTLSDKMSDESVEGYVQRTILFDEKKKSKLRSFWGENLLKTDENCRK